MTKLNQWVNYLDQVQLPVLKNTLRKILQITESDRATVARLASAIMHDSDLTANVLKLANSVVYNPSKTPVNTISRAIMVIGFNSVKTMALTSALIDQMQKSSQREQLSRCLCKSVHAAVQARAIAIHCDPKHQEDIFVAALLTNLGEAAFWASNRREADQLYEEQEARGAISAEVQRQFLGTTFKALTRALVHKWSLGSLVEESVAEQTKCTLPARIVKTAATIAQLQFESIPQHETASIKLLRPLLEQDEMFLKRSLQNNRETAIKLAETLGIVDARKYLSTQAATQITPQKPDPLVQLDYLQKIMTLPTGKVSDELFDYVLNGIHSGVGMERVALFISKPSREILNGTQGKSTPANSCYQMYKFLGKGVNKWYAGKSFESESPLPLFVSFKLRASHLKCDSLKKQDAQSVFDAPFDGASVPAVAVNVQISNDYVLMLYADRCNIAEISAEQGKSIQLFAQQLIYKATQRQAATAASAAP